MTGYKVLKGEELGDFIVAIWCLFSEEGKSVEEIAAITNRPTFEVREWLKKLYIAGVLDNIDE